MAGIINGALNVLTPDDSGTNNPTNTDGTPNPKYTTKPKVENPLPSPANGTGIPGVLPTADPSKAGIPTTTDSPDAASAPAIIAPPTRPDLTLPPSGATSPPAAASTSPSATAWTPTAGIVNQVTGITPATATATGYDPAAVPAAQGATGTGYTATGYTAAQGTAAQSTENVSDAVSRILAKDSPLQQQARADSDAAMNARGLLNSSIATGAGEDAVIKNAGTIAAGDVQNAQFNVGQANSMGQFNVDQLNKASSFVAQATNDASAFTAQAKNAAEQFTAGEANKSALFAVEQANNASSFLAQAQNAVSQNNAQAYNDAMQKYTDAKNAALAALNDAQNLAARDTAQIAAAQKQTETQVAGQEASAAIGASAQVSAAGIAAAASEANTALNARTQAEINSATQDAETQRNAASIAGTLANTGLNITGQQAVNLATLNSQQFNAFQTGYQNLLTAQMEPDARTNAIHNYMALWSGSPYLPPGYIDVSKFPAASTPSGG